MNREFIVAMILILFAVTGCTPFEKEQKEAEKEQKETVTIDETASVFLIDQEQKYQVIESFGTSGCWWAQYVGGWDNEYKETGKPVRDEIAMLLFDKEYGIGLTSYRYNIGAGSAESGLGTYWDPHRRTQSFETAPGVYDWGRDANAVWFLKKAVELGANEITLFCNSPLERLTINGMAQVTKGESENIASENYDDFATYVMDVAQHFAEEGIPVAFVSPINEPQWDWFEGQEGCHYEPGKIAGVYRAFLEELQKRPLLSDVKLSGPESGEWKGEATSYTSAILNDAVLREHFDTIDNHSYWTDASSKVAFRNWMDLKYPDVKLRMSEWCEMVNGSDVTMDSAFHLAQTLAEDLSILNVVSWQNWVGVAPGGYRDGLIYVNQEKKTLNPIKRLWAYGNFSRFIRPGYQRINISGDISKMDELHPIAFIGQNDEKKEELVLVFINESSASHNIFLDNANGVEYTEISIHETSENYNLEEIYVGEYSEEMSISLNPQSITTILLSRNGE